MIESQILLRDIRHVWFCPRKAKRMASSPFMPGGSPTLMAARTPTTGVNRVAIDADAARHRFNRRSSLTQVNLLENIVMKSMLSVG
jgi:hypothetical protein